MRKFFIFLIIFLHSIFIYSNPKPLFKTFGPTITKGSGINWQVTQTKEGLIIVASSAGVKIFDGYNWEIVKNRLNSEVYSIHYNPEDCNIYVGGLEDFGYIELDNSNKWTYISLFNLLPLSQTSFGKIWQTIITENVYFISEKFIFEYDQMKITIHQPENNTFYKAFVYKNTFFVQEEGVGLFAIVGGKKKFIKNSNIFNDKLIEFILPTTQGAKVFFSDGVVAQCKIENNEVKDVIFESNQVSKYIKNGSLRKILHLFDGNYAFALGNAGVVITDSSFHIKCIYNQENKIINEFVNDIYEDYFGNLWTAEEYLIRFINYGSPYSIYTNSDGIFGVIHSFVDLKNAVYLSDQYNIYIFENSELKKIHQINEIIRKIYKIDENSFFVLTNKAIYIFEKQKFTKLFEFSEGKNIFTFDNANKIFGVYNNHLILIFSIKFSKVSFEFLKTLDQVEISDIVVDTNKRIWFSTTSSGVGFLFEGKIKFYDTKSGLPSYFNNRIVYVNNQIYILTQEGIFKPDKYLNNLRRTSDFGDYISKQFVTNINPSKFGLFIKLTNEKNQNEFYLINSSLTIDSDFNKIFKYLPERGFAGWHLTHDDKLLISFIEGLYVLDLNKSHRLYQPLEITVQQMLYNQKGYYDEKRNRIVLNYDYGPLQIFITSPYYEGQDKITYFYRIKNGNNEWQELKNSNIIVIPQLHFGNYEIQIYARNIYGINSEIKSIPIHVKTPWYLNLYFIIFLVILIVIILLYIQKLRESYLAKKNKELEELIQLRTKELIDEKKELERSKEELYELSKQRNQLLGVYAHDLKNPLSAIDGIKELMEVTISTTDLDESIKKELMEYLSMIKSSTTQMMSIIQDILSSVRQDSFKQKIDKKIVDIIEILSEHYSLMNNYARQKNIQIHFQPKGKYLVNVDERKIGEVFQNLLSNAIKYSNENSTVEIGINTEIRNGKEFVKISIKDQGPGFTEEDKKKMFGLFQRLSAKPTKGESSTGLGLYIVKNYTELNDGFVELESTYGEGSTFHIYLPLVEKIV
ncbi:MAG: ATP-binding protein [Thermaurantimonas sp.]|uniref:sensor histidine kinase n=1 Tax=Thermaurantimonas sp. TaxID=2681568 RepID=UPI00391B34E2